MLGFLCEGLRLIDVVAHEEEVDGVFELFVLIFVGQRFNFFREFFRENIMICIFGAITDNVYNLLLVWCD